jgi:hypothetical protein
MREMFNNEDFRFGFEIVLGSTYRGYADVGEVLATAERVKDGDGDAWVREWTVTAERLEADARAAEGAGNRVQGPGAVPAGGQLSLDGAVLDHPLERARAPARALEAAPGLLGQGGRPVGAAGRTAQDPV